MTQIAVTPYVLKDALLQIATDNYEKHVSNVLFTPNVTPVTWQGLTPDAAFSDASNPTWTCQMDYAQDWTTTNSLAQYLLTNAGQQKVAVFKPLGATTGKPIFTATIIIVPGPIGGAVNTVQTGTVTMGVIGQVVKTAAP
jgi:hypothetical protein